MTDRRAVRQRAADAVAAGPPLRWFEQLSATDREDPPVRRYRATYQRA